MPVSWRRLRSPRSGQVGSAAGAAAEAVHEDRRRQGLHSGLMTPLNDLLDWLDSRTGWRTGRKTLLEEPIQAGVGWWFVTGSILLLLLTVQFVTGVVLAMFYVPTPDHAYDSIRFIMERLTFGHVLRGLHFFGASFIVVAAVVHMLRVVALGSYKN